MQYKTELKPWLGDMTQTYRTQWNQLKVLYSICSDDALKQEVYTESDSDNGSSSEVELDTESEAPTPSDRSEACATDHSSCKSESSV